jgi:hypothetical protein
MAKLVNIAMAALRFVIALAVGLFLLFALNIALAFAGAERFHGIIFIAGFVLIVWAAMRIAAPGWLATFDRAGGTAAAGRMAKFGAIAMAALRFVVALAIGLFLLFVLNAMLMFAGVERFHGLIFIPGIVLAVATAIRIAMRGRLSTFERTAGTAAAGVSALIFAGLAFAALSGLSLLAIIWFLAHFGAGPGAFVAINAWFERGTAFVVLMQVGIGASLAATWLLWRRRNGHTSPRI